MHFKILKKLVNFIFISFFILSGTEVFAATTDANLILDDNTADSPQVIMRDADEQDLTLQKLDTGDADIINTEGSINLKPSGDTNDYLYLSTTTDLLGLFWEGVLTYTNDPAIRINSSGQLEYRDQDAAGYVTFDSLSIGSANFADLSDVVLTGAAQGDIVYFNGTNWVNLSVGTSGQFLQTQGSGSNPVWANSAGATSLDAAYNGGNSIDVDGSAVTLTVSDTDNNEALNIIQNDTTNNPTAMSIINAGTGDDLTIINSSASADGITLTLYHNSASPADADVVATIDLEGEDSASAQTTYAQITAISNDVTDATEDGELVFSAMKAGTLTEAMRIDESGYVGVGTASPSARLDLGNVGNYGVLSNQLPFRISHNDNSNTSGESFIGLRLDFEESRGDLSGKQAVIGAVRVNDWANNVGLVFYTSSGVAVTTEQMRITGAGRVGIGDTTPDHTLDVAGNIGLDALGYINYGDTDGITGYGFRDNAGTVEFKNSGGSWASFGSSGGSTLDQAYNAGSSIDVDTSAVTLTVSDTDNNEALNIIQNDTTNNPTAMSITNAGTGDSLQIDTSAFVVEGGGNVGIGTTTPSAPLHVVGQCVTGDTRLRRRRKRKRARGLDGNDGDEYIYDTVRIDQIEAGDEVLTLDESTGEFTYSQVNARMDMGQQEVFELVTQSGKVIKTTDNHPYLKLLKSKKQPQGRFEVDQSVRIEEINRDTFISLANATDAYTIIIPGHLKRQIQERYRRQGKIKHFAPELMAKAIVALVRDSGFLVHQLVMDLEYPGYEQKIEQYLINHIDETEIYFQSVGKKSPAHRAAYLTYKGLLKPQHVMQEAEVKEHVKAQKKDRESLTDKRTVTPGMDTWIRSPLGLKKLYHTQDGLSTQWTKTAQLKPGDRIATLDGWEYIRSLRSLGGMQTWDIEVQGTHNFVGNDIVAHNTYITGSVGIGDATPDHTLDVAGNIGMDASGYINYGDTDGSGGYGFRDNAGNVEFKNSGGSWASFGSSSGDTLDQAYNAGSSIDVDTNAVTLTVSDTDNNEALTIIQNDTTNNSIAMSITNAGTGDDLSIINSSAGADGTTLTLHHNSASPADADVVATIDLEGEDSVSTQTTYAQITAISNDVTDATEDGELVFSNMVAGTLTEAMRIDESGNVGIGTASPTYKLHVLGDIIGAYNGTESDPIFKINSSNTGLFKSGTNGIGFSTAAIEKMRIEADGDVGIGTTSPDRLLHVEISDAGTNAIVYGERISHITSGTAAVGFGTGMEMELEGADGTNLVAGAIDTVWTDAATGTEDADMVFNLATAGTAAAEVARITSLGNFTATSIGGITEANLVDKNAAEAVTGAWDFGGGGLEIPNSTAPALTVDGQIGLETDADAINIQAGSGTVGMIPSNTDVAIPLIQQKDITLLEPDQIITVEDEIVLLTVDSYNYPNGIVVTAIRVATSEASSDTYNIESWDTPVIASATKTTIDAVTLSAAAEATETMITSATVNAGSYIAIDLDDAQDNIASVHITIWFYVRD